MVIFEAARAITELNGVTNRELTPAITVLQLFLSSSKPVLRFAAVRTLNKVACFFHCANINLLIVTEFVSLFGVTEFTWEMCMELIINLTVN